jgi:hypothetical protein
MQASALLWKSASMTLNTMESVTASLGSDGDRGTAMSISCSGSGGSTVTSISYFDIIRSMDSP